MQSFCRPAALSNSVFSKAHDICVSICFTEAEVRALAKERQKKDNHNLSKSNESNLYVFCAYVDLFCGLLKLHHLKKLVMLLY